jgi:hypothetical protein
MTDKIDYISGSGYLTLGVLMLAIAGLCLAPNSMSSSNMNAFRIFGGITLIIIGLIAVRFNDDRFTAAIMILSGLLFVLAGQTNLGSNRDFVVVLFGVGTALVAVMSFISGEGKNTITAALALMPMNLLFRYFLGTASDGTCVTSGIVCLISAALFVYIGLAMTSKRYELPLP